MTDQPPSRAPVPGDSVSFTDATGSERHGRVRDHKAGRLAWRGREDYLVEYSTGDPLVPKRLVWVQEQHVKLADDTGEEE